MLSLNLGEPELADESYLAALGEAALAIGIDPQHVRLEIPVVLLDGERSHSVAARMRQARDLGFGVLLEQFGPDGEALKWLSSLPLSGVKLGRHVMRALQEEGECGAMYRSILAMRGAAAALGLPLIVTGVETNRREVTIGYQSGAVDYVSVPVVPDLLRAKVHAEALLGGTLAEEPERWAQADPVIAADPLGSSPGQTVVLNSDGLAVRELIGDSKTPVRFFVIAVVDE